MLSDLQIARYSRQIILPAVGGSGQQKLLQTRMAVLGDQETARTAAAYLAAAGVGELLHIGNNPHLVDELNSANPDCRVSPAPLPKAEHEAAAIVGCCDIVIDAGEKTAVTKLLNLQCCAARKPLVWACTAAAVGEVSVFAGFRDSAPCFECWQTHAAILPEAAGDPAVAAMLSGAVRALVGTLLATEAIKFALGLEPTLSGSLLVCDALDLSIRKTAVDKNPSCPICAESV